MISVFYTVAVFQGGLNVPDSALCWTEKGWSRVVDSSGVGSAVHFPAEGLAADDSGTWF